MINQRLSRSLQNLARQQTQCLRVQRNQTIPSPFLSRSFASSSPHQISATRRHAQAQEAETKKDDSSLEEAAAEQSKPSSETQQAKPEDASQKELETKKREVIDLTDRLKRQVAEYRNLQEQTKREVQAAKDFALQRFSKDLLDSVDNLDRALTTVPQDKLTEENKDLVNLHSGLKMTEQILMQTLKKHGLERFDPAENSDKFDPNKHEAVFQTPVKDKQDGTVFHTQQKGFTLNGRIMRAAKVGVVKNS